MDSINEFGVGPRFNHWAGHFSVTLGFRAYLVELLTASSSFSISAET